MQCEFDKRNAQCTNDATVVLVRPPLPCSCPRPLFYLCHDCHQKWANKSQTYCATCKRGPYRHKVGVQVLPVAPDFIDPMREEVRT